MDMSIPTDSVSLAKRHDLRAYNVGYVRFAIHREMPIAAQEKK